MEWGNALKHLGLPWGGAGLTTQAPESWERGVMGEGGWVEAAKAMSRAGCILRGCPGVHGVFFFFVNSGQKNSS